jgi:hypothetical protein
MKRPSPPTRLLPASGMVFRRSRSRPAGQSDGFFQPSVQLAKQAELQVFATAGPDDLHLSVTTTASVKYWATETAEEAAKSALLAWITRETEEPYPASAIAESRKNNHSRSKKASR